MVVDNRGKILSFIKGKGPVLPFQIAKHIGTDIIMGSAHLAELSATGKVKVSHIKVGGSPLYYIPGQESMLSNFTGSLNEKELRAYNLLKEKTVLKDSELDSLTRVAFKEMRDFAIPLNVNYNNSVEVFWKFFSANDSDAEAIIRQKLGIKEEKKEIIEQKQEVQKKIEQTQELQEEKKAEDSIKKENPEKLQERKKEIFPEKTGKKESSKPKKERKEKSEFYDSVILFFQKNKIEVIETEIIKKSSEIDFIIEVPSVVGNLRCYCKAKSKKKIDENELSSFFVKAQYKKLQPIFITDGDLSPRANDMLKKELTGMIFKRL